MIGVKYCGPILEGSGYAEHSRMNIAAIDRYCRDINLTLEACTFESYRPNIGRYQEMINRLGNKQIDYQVKIIQTTPNILPQLAEKGKININYTTFETDRIPEDWVGHLNNLADAVIVPCQFNVETFKKSGVTKPIYVIPPGINLQDYQPTTQKLVDIPPEMITFYSIFQLQERKNFNGLLTAYMAAFDEVEDVCLVLKTYGNGYTDEDKEKVRGILHVIKGCLRLKKTPKIMLIGDMLTNEQISQLHQQCDIFVLPHRGEGICLPIIQAMAYGKPVIATGWSGNMEMMNEQNSYPIPYSMTIVANMPWTPHYTPDMEWADPNLPALKNLMRETYGQVKASKLYGHKDYDIYKRAAQGKKDISEKFTEEQSAKKFEQVIKDILGV